MSTELATVAPPALLRPIAKPADFLAVHTETAALIRDALEEGRDYGKIPGTQKNTLLKPGAERLCLAFGLRCAFEIMAEEIDHDRENRTRNGVSYGLYRFVVRCVVYGPDGREVGQGVGSCSTLESKYISRPRDSENTALKMAKKRAQVDAVLSTLGLSDRFTQDVEEMLENEGADQAAPGGMSEAERQRNAGLYFKRTVKGSAEQFAEFKGACEKDQWPTVALDAEKKGIMTFLGLMRFVKGDHYTPAAEFEDAEFTEEDPKSESPAPSAADSAASAQGGAATSGNASANPISEAFGWKPVRYPSDREMEDERTPGQVGMGHGKAKERGIEDDMYTAVRETLLEAFTLSYTTSKGVATLWIDFLMTATDEQIAAAVAATHERLGQGALAV